MALLLQIKNTMKVGFFYNIYKLSRKWPSSYKSVSSRQMSSQYPWIIKIVIKISPSGIFLKETTAINHWWRWTVKVNYLFDICWLWGQWDKTAGVENVSVPLMRQTEEQRDQSTQHPAQVSFPPQVSAGVLKPLVSHQQKLFMKHKYYYNTLIKGIKSSNSIGRHSGNPLTEMCEPYLSRMHNTSFRN